MIINLPLFYLLQLTLRVCAAVVSDELLHLHVVTRNGHRAPDVKFTTESDEEFLKKWPNGEGELTDLGLLQQYTLGQWLRRRYADFFPSNYVKSDIYVRSLSAEKSMMSAAASMAGLFRPKERSQQFVNNLAWRPVPIHTSIDDRDDSLLNGIEICSKVRDLIHRASERQEIKNLLKLYNETLNGLEKHVQGGPFDMMNTWMIYDRFIVQNQEHIKLPTWATNSMLQILRMFYIKAVDLFYHYPESIKLGGGVHLNEIIQTMKTIAIDKSALQTGNKMVYYSGSDFTITSIFSILKIWDHNLMPPFSSALIIELWRNQLGKHFIRLVYRNETNIDAEPYIMTIQGCTANCPLAKFYHIFKHDMLQPSHFDQKCNMKQLKATNDWMNHTILQRAKVYTIREFGKPCDCPKIIEKKEQYPTDIVINLKMAMIFSALLGSAISIILIAIVFTCRRYLVHKRFVKYRSHLSVDFH